MAKLKGRTKKILLLLAPLCALVFFSSCSPMYIIRAGWEEAGILWRREDISELIAKDDLDPKFRQTLETVLQARSFAAELGLVPKGSFSQYSDVKRDVLVWVLSACAKTAFVPKTWWFPIVGRVPYKGFFEKEDGLAEAQQLKDKGYDVSLRPSPAFSTLGWFNDPFLSTMKHFDEISLVNTVIHEILHNTVWIPNHATFNETLANLIGATGSIEYFEKTYGPDDLRTAKARDRWHDEQIYARFLEELIVELEKFYRAHPAGQNPDPDKNVMPEIISGREEIFTRAQNRWKSSASELRSGEYRDISKIFNNAVIISQKIYLDRMSLFSDLAANCNQSTKCLIEQAQEIESACKKDSKLDPFTALAQRVAETTQTPN